MQWTLGLVSGMVKSSLEPTRSTSRVDGQWRRAFLVCCRNRVLRRVIGHMVNFGSKYIMHLEHTIMSPSFYLIWRVASPAKLIGEGRDRCLLVFSNRRRPSNFIFRFRESRLPLTCVRLFRILQGFIDSYLSKDHIPMWSPGALGSGCSTLEVGMAHVTPTIERGTPGPRYRGFFNEEGVELNHHEHINFKNASRTTVFS